MTKSSSRALAGATLIGGVLCLTGPASAEAQVYRAFMVDYDALTLIETVGALRSSVSTSIAGLTPGDTLVGLDFRPQNGFLYGLGFNRSAGTVRLYALSYRTASAVPLGVAGTFVAANGTTPVPIQGVYFGVSFDPTTDRLRVVSDAGQNFRIDPNSGAFVDGDLGGSPGTVPGVNMDAPINGAVTEVSAAAYTNKAQNAQTTTLYTLDASTHALYVQTPANSGTQRHIHTVTVDGSPLPFSAVSGFDIPPDASGTGFAVLSTGQVWSLYAVDLTTAAATQLGTVGLPPAPGGGITRGLAIQAQAIPNGRPAAALGAHSVIRFDTALPAIAVTQPLTGLTAGESLRGIDWRPATGQLYGLGFDAGHGSGSATLYRLDPQTGAATIMGVAGSIADGTGAPISLAGAAAFGFDFDPVTDLIRVVTSNGLNFRIDPNDGTVVGVALDPEINGLPAGSTGVTGAAFTNSFGHLPTGGSTATTLYTLDPTSHMLFIQTPANSGTQTSGTIVTVGSTATVLAFDAVHGFDIPPVVAVSTANAAATGRGYAVLTVGGATRLYGLDLSSGQATELGAIAGSTQPVDGLAVGDGLLSTTITAVSSANPASIGQLVTITATVQPSTLSGLVLFTVPGWSLPCIWQGVALSAGTAVCSSRFNDAGMRNVVATYVGDANYAPASTGPIPQQVIQVDTTTTTTLTVNPTQVNEGQSVTFVASVFHPRGATGLVFFELDGTPVTMIALIDQKAAFTLRRTTAGTHTVTARFAGMPGFAPSVSEPATLIVTTPTHFRQYFAEGATGAFFHTDLACFNPSASSAAHVTVTYLLESGPPLGPQAFTLGPWGRQTIAVNSVVPEASGVAILIDSDQPIAATRQMTWGSPPYGSTLESGASDASTTWYFAEGATNVFSLFYLLANPNDRPATATLTHLLENGGAPIIQTAVVPAFARRTLFINDVPGLRSAAFATTVMSDLPIVAERAMYLNTTDRPWEGGATGHGTTAPSTIWSFAEGATGFFHSYLLIGNPNDTPTRVTTSYRLFPATFVSKTFDMPARSRQTVEIAREDPRLESTSVAITIKASLPVVAERAMWWGEPFTDGSVSLGSTETGTAWAIGEGAEGGPADEATFVLITNEALDEHPAVLTLVYDDGTSEARSYPLPISSRLTVRIGEDFPNAAGRKFSMLVERPQGESITVEYARYQSPGGSLADGGGVAQAVRIR